MNNFTLFTISKRLALALCILTIVRSSGISRQRTHAENAGNEGNHRRRDNP